MNMIEHGAKQMTLHLVKNGGAKQEDADIISYGLYAILLKTVQTMILIVVSVPLGIFWNTMAFTMYYCILRKYAGGAHAKTPASCIIGFTTIAIAANSVAVNQPPSALVMVLFMLICVGIVWIKAPVTTPNGLKSPTAILVLRKKSRITVMLQMMLVMILLLTKITSYSILVSASLATALAALTLLLKSKKEN